VQKNLRDKLGLNIVAVTRAIGFWRSWPGSRSGDQAQKDWPEFIAVFDDEAARIGQGNRRVDWLVQERSIRRDRVVEREGPEPDHQEPPQRGRVAVRHEAQAD